MERSTSWLKAVVIGTKGLNCSWYVSPLEMERNSHQTYKREGREKKDGGCLSVNTPVDFPEP